LAVKYPKGNIKSLLTFQYGKTLEVVQEILNNAEGRLNHLMENQRNDLQPLITETSSISQNRNIIKIIQCNNSSLSHTIVANQMASGKRVPEEELLRELKKQKTDDGAEAPKISSDVLVGPYNPWGPETEAILDSEKIFTITIKDVILDPSQLIKLGELNLDYPLKVLLMSRISFR